jgi:prophage regulatory protein
MPEHSARTGVFQMKLIRLPETLAKTGLSRTRLYDAVAAGTFPRPCKLGPDARAIGFVESEVDAWIEARISAREHVAA